MRLTNVRNAFASFMCAVALMFSGCTKKEPPLVVLTTGENAPFSMCDEKGNFSGFDIDLIRMIAGSMNRELVFKQVPFSEMIDGVRTRKGDIAIGAISITEERSKQVDFSPAYHQGSFCLLMLKSTSSEIKDLKNQKVGVRRGTWQEKAVKTAWADLPNIFIESNEDDKLPIATIVDRLMSAEWSAVVLDLDEANYIRWLYGNKNNDGSVPELKIVPLDIGSLGMGIATAPASIYSKPVTEFIEQHSEDIQKLAYKWFSSLS